MAISWMDGWMVGRKEESKQTGRQKENVDTCLDVGIRRLAKVGLKVGYNYVKLG